MTKEWLLRHPDSVAVRVAYIELVARRGAIDHVKLLLQEINEWLRNHPDDTWVRMAYLNLVERQLTSEDVDQILHSITKWVELHPQATGVWIRLISSFVKLQKMDKAVILVEKALSIHSKNPNLLNHYLRLIQNALDEQTVKNLFSTAINTHSNDISIKNAYGRWLHNHGYLIEAEDILKGLINDKLGYLPAKYNYGKLLVDMSRYDEAKKQFEQALIIYKGHQMAHDGLAQALRCLATLAEQKVDLTGAEQYFAEAEREFRQAISCAGIQKQPQAVFNAHLGWFYIDRKRWEDAMRAFEHAIAEDPDFFANYWGKGCALMGLAQFQDAADFLRLAIEKAPEDFQPPDSEEIPQLLKKCQASIGDI